MATTVTRPLADGTATPETMSFDEAMRRYEGEWLVLRVVAGEQGQEPEEVQVLVREVDRDSAWRAFGRLRDAAPDPAVQELSPRYYVTEAWRRIRTGDEARRMLAELAASDDPSVDELAGRGVWLGLGR
jgi:hypothetical protein